MYFLFPYYIVRFKQNFKFPYYIKFIRFPYYIVRFKHLVVALWEGEKSSFHTTQYDLNFIYFLRRLLKKRSFHTTQYDLNFYILFTATIKKKKFPYYIVRFKLEKSQYFSKPMFCFHTTQYDLNPRSVQVLCLLLLRFHTTQYDLNSIVEKDDCTRRKKFPYYIVRFKRGVDIFAYVMKYSFHTIQYDLNVPGDVSSGGRSKSFHTTQYDLNLVGYGRVYGSFVSFHTTQYDLNLKKICVTKKKYVQFPYYIVRFKPEKHPSPYRYVDEVSILHSTI